jgi:uncharacterized protein YerC
VGVVTAAHLQHCDGIYQLCSQLQYSGNERKAAHMNKRYTITNTGSDGVSTADLTLTSAEAALIKRVAGALNAGRETYAPFLTVEENGDAELSARQVTKLIWDKAVVKVQTRTVYASPAHTRVAYYDVCVSNPSQRHFTGIRAELAGRFTVAPMLIGSDPYEHLRVTPVA